MPRSKKSATLNGPVLGIDPGSLFTGYGVVSEVDGSLRCLAFGVIEGKKGESTSERLLCIGQGLAEVFRVHRPSAVAIEKTFFAKNADSATKLGQARGVALYEAAKADVRVCEYNPTEIKLGLSGNGRADKEQVQFMVRALLGLPAMSRFDMSDALALAIHHIRVCSTLGKMSEMEMQS